ncbi:DUF4865 family protein [Streptomyces sp. NBC_00670]|jgi:hypothetical protein|uniref:DUF4865 family protein n=1 Tax=Streptomyces sp. NBC_00670 TaxID=2975804 RepID=UPI002E303928|nr:DUF4865 family protein [Streptomyces sp. NBC_00670]
MQAMQYEITLPADYDMGIVRERVARVGHALDDWDGLGLKAYLVRERGVDGSHINQYAPFYLWHEARGMNAFLYGGPFQGFVDDFGRPSVRQWTGLWYEESPVAGAGARVAVRHRRPVPEGIALGEVAEEVMHEAGLLVSLDGAVCAAVAVDSRHWEVVRFSLWEHEAPKTDGDVFQVLRLSAPGRDRLPRGRQW